MNSIYDSRILNLVIFFPLLGFSDAKYLGPNAGD